MAIDLYISKFKKIPLNLPFIKGINPEGSDHIPDLKTFRRSLIIDSEGI